MKKFLFITAYLLFSCSLALSQEGNIDSLKPVATNNSVQIVTEHDTTTPERAIIGHWVEQNNRPYSKTHLYVTPGKIITVTVHEIPYKVLSSDVPERVMKVHAGPESGGHQKTFSFSTDMSSIAETITIFDKPQTRTFLYVDGKREP